MTSSNAKTDPGLGGATIVDPPKPSDASPRIVSTDTAPMRDRLSFDTDPRLALVATSERELVRGLGRDTDRGAAVPIDGLPLGPAIADEAPSRIAFATDPRLALASPEERALLRGLGKGNEPEPTALPPVDALVAPRAPTAPLAAPSPEPASIPVESPRAKRPGATTVRLRLASWELGRFAAGIVVVVIALMALLVWLLREPKDQRLPAPNATPSAPVATTSAPPSMPTLFVEPPASATAPSAPSAAAVVPPSSASSKPAKPHTSAIGPGTSEPGAVPAPRPSETAPAPIPSPPAPKASGPDPLHLQGM